MTIAKNTKIKAESIKSLEAELNNLLAGRPGLEQLIDALEHLEIPRSMAGSYGLKLISEPHREKLCWESRAYQGQLFKNETGWHLFAKDYCFAHGRRYELIKKLHAAYPLPGQDASKILGEDISIIKDKRIIINKGPNAGKIEYALIELTVPNFFYLRNLFRSANNSSGEQHCSSTGWQN